MSSLKDKITVMERALAGETVEMYNGYDWTNAVFPSWNWTDCNYRIKEVKPEPVYYYKWKLYQGLTLSISEYTARELDGGWTRIESSKTTYEELV